MKESMYILLYDNTFTKRIASSYRHASLLMSVLFDRSVRDSTYRATRADTTWPTCTDDV